MLLLTHTTLSVPSLTGAIMCMGVATANSILLVSFAREQMHGGWSARAAALEAGFARIRPVLMTALAMIIGMLPMALGLGEGGEQNAPLGRAVIGGLALRHRRDAVLRSLRVLAGSRPEGGALMTDSPDSDAGSPRSARGLFTTFAAAAADPRRGRRVRRSSAARPTRAPWPPTPRR